MREGYDAPAGSGEGEIVVRRSRFAARADRCADADALAANIAAMRALHPDASHWCYAAVFGGPSRIERYGDGGEPPGTAGRPMLDAVRGSGLSDVSVVVARRFGGILLGAGGLAQAYSGAAAAALAAVAKERMEWCASYVMEVDYGRSRQASAVCRSFSAAPPAEEFSDRVAIRLDVPEARAREFEAAAAEATRGACAPARVGEGYVPVRARARRLR